MDSITTLLSIMRQRNARRKQLLKDRRAQRSRFRLEPLESRVLLSAAPLVVTQLAADASGFTAQFNQAVDKSVLNLYDTSAGTLGPADVTVVGASTGAVRGTLVVDSNQITFIKTGGVLAPDIYTITMRSASDGVKAGSGGLLDGNSDGTAGDNYIHAFTITPVAGPTVGIPDFARGPGQIIQVPAPSDGIPITLSDGSGVTSVDVTLHYDPELLTIIGVTPGSSLPTGSTVLPDLTVPGTLTLHVTSPTAMSPGPLDLVRLVSEVPHTAPYGSTGTLDISGVSINNGSIASTADDGVEAVAYFGEATGNQSYSALDGSRILRVVVGLDPGYAAYPYIDPILMTDITGNGILSALDGTRILQEVVGLDRSEIEAITADIQAQLSNDTGTSSTDDVTFDPTISGTAKDDGTITSFKARVDNSSSMDVTADLINGNFSFTRARLEQILGSPLGDGTHTLALQALDNGGNASTVSTFSFTLDTTQPTITSFGLSAGSDTGTAGDNITADAQVLLTGASEAGATLTLNASALLAGAGGVFQIPDVALANGDNAFTLVASDVAGNSAQRNLTVTRQGTVSTDVALQWNQQALEAIRLTVMDPPLAARVLAMVSLAQYDTLAAIDGTPAYLIHENFTGPISVDAALAEAAYTVLYALFPSLRSNFDSALNGLLATVTDGAAKTNALALGLSIGNGILAIRANDGSDSFVDYPGSTEVGMWRPDEPMFDVASEPQWGDVTPFALTSGEEFRPDPPPALDSTEYAQSVNEIQSLGSATGSTRTSDQTQIAQFWADGKGSYTPVGHWDQIAQQVALSEGNSLSSNVRLMAQLNVAMADSAIAAWDAKYFYGLWRPIDAIQNADLDGNAATTADPNWTPLLITPSFPEYVSGHSTFSAAAAAVLAAAFGDNTAFSIGASTLPGVTRSYTSFTQAAQEAGRSRIYGGIHYEFTNQAGQELGQQVAAAVLERFVLNQDVQPPVVLADNTPAATNANVTLTGQILDNLSGVAQTQFKIDNNAFQALALDATGHFSITTALALNGSGDGLHTISIQTEDAANNSAPVFTRSFTLDTRLPSITLSSIANNATIDVSTLLVGTVDSNGSNLSVLNYKFDNGTPRSLIFDAITGTFHEPIAMGNLSVGSHSLTLTAKDASGNQSTLTRTVNLVAATPLTITSATPGDGSSEVGSTFRPQVFFSKSILVADLNNNNFFATDSAGNKLAATIVPSQDGGFAWLFFSNPMPGGETITINVDGSTIRSQDGTQLLDADGDATPGGVFRYRFTTVNLLPVPGTTLTGRVFDPGPDLQPMTFDDIRRGPDGVIDTADDVFLNPIAGAKVFILGRDSEFVLTDAQGRFTLTNVPAGDVKLVIDGRTATNAPVGIFFPEMVMDLTVEPGLTNTVMGSMGTPEEQRANESRDEVYLPRLQQSILQTVSGSQNTVVGVDANSAPTLTDSERAQLKLVVQPGSLVDANGVAVVNGQVGISTVPPELVKDMLPPGVLQHTFDITIQAPGVAAFNTPLQITFPNVFNAAPGEKLNYLSFDHTTGRLVIEGTATVSEDGLSVTTDPGQGITKPGWHGLTSPGKQNNVNVGNGANGNGSGSGGDGGDGTGDGGSGGGGTGGGGTGGGGTGGNGGGGGPVDGDRNGNGVPDIDEKPKDPPSDNDYTVALVIEFEIPEHELFAEPFFQVSLPDPLPEFEISMKFEWPESDLAQNWNVGSFGFTVPSWAQWAVPDHSEFDIFNLTGNVEGTASVGADFTGRFNSLLTSVGFQGLLGAEIEATLTAQISGGVIDWLPSEAKDWISEPRSFDVPFPPIAGFNVGPRQFTLPFSIPPVLKNTSFKVGATAGVRFGAGIKITPKITVDKISGGTPAAPAELASSESIAPNAFSALLTSTPLLDDQSMYSLSRGFGSDARAHYRYLLDNGSEIAGVADANGQFNVFLPNDTGYTLSIYRPSTNAWQVISGNTGPSGQATSSTHTLEQIGGFDSDGDGIPDIGEYVLGTRSDLRDTDGDGVNDAAELIQGSDPLGGRGLPTGVIAAASLQGEAKAVVVQGSTTSSNSQTAYVATGSYGLAIVDASQTLTPIVKGQLDLPGDSVDVSVDSRLAIAAVASGAGGLNLVGVANPNAPVLLQTIAQNATQVEAFEGIAYVSVGTQLRSYDLITGENIQILDLGGANIAALAREGQSLYSIDANRTMREIDANAGIMTARGTLVLPTVASKLVVGGGIAYIGTEVAFPGGFETVNVANPDNLILLSGVDSTSLAGKALALNGSGLAVGVGSPGAFGNLVELFNVSNPADTSVFITQFSLPADPFDVAIGGGIAFIADGTGDLQVVNYISADNKGVAPVVTASLASLDVDPITPGIQILEGSRIDVDLAVTDDVQVRNTELLLNGSAVSNDVSFPFELSDVLPTIASNGSNQITLQVRATDTGGNTGVSSPIALQIVPDTFAPILTASNVVEGGAVGHSFRSVILTFSEAIDPSAFSITAVQLIDSVGNVIAAQNFEFRQGNRQVQITFAQQAVGSYTMRIDQAQVKDRVGNAMGTGVLDTHFTINQATIEWVAAAGGNWNTAANWSTGVLPTATDDVFIGVTSNPVVFSTGSVTVQSLVSKAGFALSGGTLNLVGASQIDGPFTLSGGTLTGTGVLTLTGIGNQWTGGTITGAGTTRFDSDLSITGNTTKTLSGTRILELNGTTTWSGNTVANNNQILFSGGTINNKGTWNDANTFDATFNNFSGVNAFNNSGVYNKQGNSVSAIPVTFNSTGTVNVIAGILRLTAGGTDSGSFNMAAGATMDFNSGTHNLNNITTAGAGTLQVSGSTSFNFVNFNGGTFPVAVLISGGNFQGTGTAFGGAVTWTGGAITGAGAFAFTNSLAISGSNTKTLSGNRILNLSGTTTWSGNTAANNNQILLSGGTINNSGTWNDANTFDSTFNDFTGTNAFNNTGTYNKQGNTLSAIPIAYNSSSTININAGTLRLTGGGTDSGTFTIASGATLDFNSGTHNLNNITTAGAGTLMVSGSTSFNFVNFNGGSFPVTLVISGGTFQGSGATFGGAVSWTGGTITGAGAFTFTNTLAITGSNNKSLSGNRILNLSGTTTWSGDTAANNNQIVFGGGTINNSGTWNDSNAFSTVFNDFTGTNVFNNTGIYNKQGSTITTIQIRFTNSSTLNVNGGTFSMTGGGTHTGTFNIAAGAILDFNSGTHNLNNITTAGAGTLQVSGSGSFNFVNFNGGTFPTLIVISGGNVQGTGTTFTNAVSWIGGEITGAGSFTFNGTLGITGSATKTLSGGRVLNLTNTTTWSGATAANNNLILFSGGTINNSGTWNETNTFNTQFNDFTGTNAFNNTGIYNKQGNTITTMAVSFNNTATLNLNAGTLTMTGGGSHTGSFNIAASAILDFNSGTHNLNNITTAGAGTLQVSGSGSFNFVNFNGGTFPTLIVISGGNVQGSGTTFTNAVSWIGGEITGTGSFTFNNTLGIAGSATKTLSGGRVLNLTNTTTWSGATAANNNQIFFTGGTINNSGTWNDTNTFNTVFTDFSGTNAFNNSGIYNKQGNTITTMAVLFSNTATFNVNAGTLTSTGGGTHTGTFNIAAGAILDFNSGTHNLNNITTAGAGTLQVSGSSSFNFVNVNGGTYPTAFALVGGTLQGTGASFTGTASWTGGTMNGAGSFTFSNTLGITGTGTKTLSGNRILNLSGTTTWSGNTALNNNQIFFTGGTINNSGTWNDLNGFSTLFNSFSGTNAFNNTGTYSKQGNTVTTIGTAFNNSGTVDVLSGSLAFTGTFAQSAGTTRLNGGNIAGGIAFNFQGGILTGSGTIAGNVTNNATINIGGVGSIGTLQITGTYTQSASGIVNLEIGGLVAGTDYDRLVITGTATLSGTLNLLLVNSFVPSTAQTFTILAYASHGATTFTTINGLTFGGGGSFSAQYGTTSLTLTAG